MGNVVEKFYSTEGEKIICNLCPHKCTIAPGKRGICGVRENIEGKLHSLNYFKFTSLALDPIEKKPLFRFYPGSKILSLGSFGCNLNCPFCQNSHISKDFKGKFNQEMSKEEILEVALNARHKGNIGIAFTYNEPIVWYETVLELAKTFKDAGLKTVLVTNGFISPEPLSELLPYIDGVNVDLKAFNEDFYKKIVKGRLAPVLDTIETIAKHCHLEVTSLIIPGLNDSPDEMSELSEFLAGINPEIPLHLSRFFPHYRMKDRGLTPIFTLKNLAEIASENLKYVYIGNV